MDSSYSNYPSTHSDDSDRAKVDVTIRSESDATIPPGNQGSTAITVGTSGVSIHPAVESSNVTDTLRHSHGGTSMQDWARDTVTSTLAAGNLPATETLTSALSAARSSELFESVKETPLSETGRSVVAETENLMSATGRLLSEKNKCDEVQQMLSEGAKVAAMLRESAEAHHDVAATFGDAKAKAEANTQDVIHSMFDVIKLMVSAPEFRSLLLDVAGLTADWLENVSIATVHDFTAQAAAHESVPFSEDIEPGARQASDQEWQDADEKQQAFRNEVQHRLLPSLRGILKRLQDQPTWQKGVRSVIDIFDAVRDRALLAVPSQTDSNTSETSSIASTLASGEAREHAEAAAGHAVRLIENFGGDLEPLQRALDDLNRALMHQRPTVDRILDKIRSLLENPSDEDIARSIYVDVLALLQGVAPHDISRDVVETGERIVDTTQEIAQNVGIDVDIPTGGVELAANVGSGLINEELVKSGEEIRMALMKLAKASNEFVGSMRADEVVQDVSQSLTGLMQALFIDEKTGEPKFKPELMNDLRRIVPALVQRLAIFPIGRIDVTTDDLDVILDNINLSTAILPKDITILTETHIAPDVQAEQNKSTLGSESTAITGQVEIKLRNVQVQSPDLVFYYYNKSFPSFADVGIADVIINGRGLDVDLVMIPARTDTIGTKMSTLEAGAEEGSVLLQVVSVNAKVHDLEFTIKRARHNWMYSLARPLIKRIISRQLESGIAQGLEAVINSLDRTVAHAVARSKEVMPSTESISSAVRSTVLKEE